MKQLRYLIIGLHILFVAGCITPARDTIFQVSTIDALLAGVYDGDMKCSSLLKHGDFGIGTFDHLDGEMVLLDGKIYQIKADGKVYRPKSSIKTPFATICQFSTDQKISIKTGSNYKTIENLLNESVPNHNLFYAIKITGQFKFMETRSVPGQQKPYPPLKEVTSDQPVFKMKNVSGTIVGFRCPPYVKGINVPGYHLHFINQDRTKGGHVLSYEILAAKCEIDVINHYSLTLPKNTKKFGETDLAQDRSTELKDIER